MSYMSYMSYMSRLDLNPKNGDRDAFEIEFQSGQ